MSIISGKKIQKNIITSLQEKLSHMSQRPKLFLIYVGVDPVIERFMRFKKKVGEQLGIEVYITKLSDRAQQAEVEAAVSKVCAQANDVDGVVIQLPLPVHLDKEVILGLVPVHMDVDILSHNAYVRYVGGVSTMVPPVVGAMIAVLEEYKVLQEDKKIVVVGQGELVGRPLVVWLQQQGLPYQVITKSIEGREDILRSADILFTGTGVPGLITPEHIKEGVVLIDAGTSEQSGVLVGDIDPSCADKAYLMTPTPGGIGPITIAVLFRNLICK
ncbi:MAG: methylenetetrahydrofolate dehydrogenase (NADP+)/methenyltetrahydrofolate cyclohydrolase [Planctomycetota bacterium]|jgi:methylenetetrahydrofolate dehydrogenase (NADP+)/methenyltetrahydrofolate cyclohydrolase